MVDIQIWGIWGQGQDEIQFSRAGARIQNLAGAGIPFDHWYSLIFVICSRVICFALNIAKLQITFIDLANIKLSLLYWFVTLGQ